MSSKPSSAYGTGNTGPSSNLMKMKFMQRGKAAEKNNQSNSDPNADNGDPTWSKNGASSVYVFFRPC